MTRAPATPPAPIPASITELVRARLASLDIREAVIVDDAFAPGLDPTRWLELVDLLREQDADLFARVSELVTGEVGTLETVPPAHLVATVSRMVLGSTSEDARNALATPSPSDPALDRLEQTLLTVGVAARKFWRIDATVPRDAKLYFLDFRLRPEHPETSGQDASALLKEIVLRLRDEGQPPAAMLMSRTSEDRRPADELEVVAREGGGFVRSNVRYLEKALLNGPEHLLFLLDDLLKSLPLGRDYFAQVRGLRTATKAAVERVAAETCGLLPADFNPFVLLLTGGSEHLSARAANHVAELFTGLLAAELRNDPDVNNSVNGLVEVLKTSVMAAPAGLESHTLHRIHSKLLYDRSKWALEAPPSFGDIYRRRGDDTGYYLLITPECDLEIRDGGEGDLAPKAEKLLFVRGTIRDERPIKKDGRFVVTALADDSTGSHKKWFYWDLRDPTILPFRQMGPDRLLNTKWGRLRREEAEDIQMRVATDLLAVGTEGVSGTVRERRGKVVLRAANGSEQVIGDVVVMEIEPPAKEGDKHWALGLGSEQLLCSADSARLSAELVTSLRRYVPSEKFVTQLGAHKVYVAEEGASVHLCFMPRNQGMPKKGAWKGPTQAAGPNVATGGGAA